MSNIDSTTKVLLQKDKSNVLILTMFVQKFRMRRKSRQKSLRYYEISITKLKNLSHFQNAYSNIVKEMFLLLCTYLILILRTQENLFSYVKSRVK